MGPIVEQCAGCAKIAVQEGQFDTQLPVCVACYSPAAKWKRGMCNLATHKRVEMASESAERKLLNPLKASKRSMGK